MSIAAALGCQVLLVGKHGVGDAVDSFNLNASYFASFGVKVQGVVFNRLPSSGYYSLDKCKESVTMYFTKTLPHVSLYGWLPEVNHLVDASPPPPTPSSTSMTSLATSSLSEASSTVSPAGTPTMSDVEVKKVNGWSEVFIRHFDINLFLKDVINPDAPSPVISTNHSSFSIPLPTSTSSVSTSSSGLLPSITSSELRDRIQREAIADGADCGG
jgi:hypothetical protein